MSSIGGFKPGDQIGLGTVVRQADIRPGDEIKQVTVDIDLDGQVSQADDKLLVKLPPKGSVPINVEGFESKHEVAARIAENASFALGFGTVLTGVGTYVGGSMLKAMGAPFTSIGVVKASVVGLVAGAVVSGAYSIFKDYQESQAQMEKARSGMIPDMVKPKMILNISE